MTEALLTELEEALEQIEVQASELIRAIQEFGNICTKRGCEFKPTDIKTNKLLIEATYWARDNLSFSDEMLHNIDSDEMEKIIMQHLIKIGDISDDYVDDECLAYQYLRWNGIPQE